MAKWLIEADYKTGLATIVYVWHNCDHNTLDMVLYMGGRQYADIPLETIQATPNDMNAYILEHLEHPGDLAHKFLDVTGDEFKGTGLDAFDTWSPAEGDDAESTDRVAA